MIVDARSLANETCLEREVCIVGSGPAGVSIAHELKRLGIDCVVLESGGIEPEVKTQRLYKGALFGTPYFPLDTARFRLFGGSSNRWGGLCRPLDSIDFTERAWIPSSGWPIGEADLQPFYRDAASLLGLADSSFSIDDCRGYLPSPLDLDGSAFENVLFHYSPQMNFAEVFCRSAVTEDSISAITHANLVDIRLKPDSEQVERLTFRSLTGRVLTVRPKLVVLAAGAIENARLLLNARHDRDNGLGNEHDLVGRYFMEHLHVHAGHLVLRETAVDLDFYAKKLRSTGGRTLGVIAPTESALRKFELPSASIAMYPASFSVGTAFMGRPPAVMFPPVRVQRKMSRSRFARQAELLKRAFEVMDGLPMRLATSRLAAGAAREARQQKFRGTIASLYFRSEQLPDERNRVLLSRSYDALGMLRADLAWRVYERDIKTIERWLRQFSEDIGRLGRGLVVLPRHDWRAEILGGPHHMGTTRMAGEARSGVVDRHCRLHSVSNLYVAGSSVFSTGGHANPTFTIVALALRLAERLRRELRGV